MKKIIIFLLLVFSSLLIAEDIAIFIKTQGEIYSQVDTTRTVYQSGDTLENNTIVMSGMDSYALLNYKYTNGYLRIFPNSKVSIVHPDSMNTNVVLSSGKILNVLKDKINGTYTVETNSTVASVRGTKFEVTLIEGATEIKVEEGNVNVLNKISGKSHTLGANQGLISSNDGQIKELVIEDKELMEEKAIPQNKDTDEGKSDVQARPARPSESSILTPVEEGRRNNPKVIDTGEMASERERKKTIEKKERPSFPQKTLTETDLPNINPVAIVLKVKGKIQLIRGSQIEDCSAGTLLKNNDRIRSEDESLALIKMVDNSSKIRVFSNSEVLINIGQDYQVLNKNIELEEGSILSTVNNKIAGKYSVSTSSTIASVRGTEFLVEEKDGVTKIVGFSGRVEVENKKTREKSTVTKGTTVISTEDGSIERQETKEVPEEVREELESTEYENLMKIKFENEDGSQKTIILEY